MINVQLNSSFASELLKKDPSNQKINSQQNSNKSENYPFDCVSTQLSPCPDVVDLNQMVLNKEKIDKKYKNSAIIKLDKLSDSPAIINGKSILNGSKISTKVKFINKTSNNYYWRLLQVVGSSTTVWPSSSTAYYVRKKSSQQVTISCTKNYSVYIGGSSTNGYYFCYGVYFDQSPSSTCYATCNGGTYTVTLN